VSRENVEVVRRGLGAFSRADFDTMRKLFHPDIEWHDQWELPGSTVSFGVEGVLRHFKAVMEDLADYRVDLEAFEEAPDGRVVASLLTSAVGRGSGAAVERRTVGVFTVREGKVARGDIFGSRREALEAVGLRE
jgi:ketosteroid isomerase-like protein